MRANPTFIRNEAGAYLCRCVCGKEFWAAAPHAKYCSDKCRLLARNDRLHSRGMNQKGWNKCLGYSCKGRGRARPPLHFCRLCRDQKSKTHRYSEGVWGGGGI
jgi:hypothetical protein